MKTHLNISFNLTVTRIELYNETKIKGNTEIGQ